jgi:quinolinate synthase
VFDLKVSSEVDYASEIERLKKEYNAVILAHYYQESEIQDLADVVGDSLELARKAKSTNADVIVFAGVHFMAETAKILNPDKMVLLPDLAAGCSLADSCPAPLFKAFRGLHPDHIAITYINCSAEVKALSDIICTSSNAENIINKIPEDQPILFSPDKNLGAYLMKKTGRKMLLWDGSCIVHETFSERKIIELKVKHPGAKIIAHPECEETVLRHADFIGSTSKLLQYVVQDNAQSYIVATEPGILHQMGKIAPSKILIAAPPESNCNCNECPYMRLNTLEKLYLCMRDKTPQINLSKELMAKALLPIERMLEMSQPA